MAQLEILEYPDPRLRLKSQPVTAFDQSLWRLIDDLFETMYASETAIGLSAPQVNDLRQVLVMDLSGNASDPQVFINPQITKKALIGLVEESCLSLPGTKVNVWRAVNIRVRAQDRDGAFFERDLERMHAVCVQHEMDHFKGQLLVDRMSIFRRLHFNWSRKRASA